MGGAYNQAVAPDLCTILIRSTAIFKASHWIIFQDYSTKCTQSKKQMKMMATTEESLLHALYLISLKIYKQKIIHHWGRVSKAVHPLCR